MSDKNRSVICETCVFYDYDDASEEYFCSVQMDEDEAAEYAVAKNRDCPYYRYYDEYKSVRKQN